VLTICRRSVAEVSRGKQKFPKIRMKKVKSTVNEVVWRKNKVQSGGFLIPRLSHCAVLA